MLGICFATGLISACTGGIASTETVLEYDASRAWKHLENMVAFGPRPAGSENLERCRKYIEKELIASGLLPVRETFTAETPEGPIEMVNLYADLAPQVEKEGEQPELIILCTHYETKKMEPLFVGANDGGSSTAVMLELARVLEMRGARDVTLRFLFVDGEEAIRWEWQDPDNRYGSRHHVQGLMKSGMDRKVRAAIIIDLVGDKDLKLTRDTYSDPRLIKIFFEAAKTNGLGEYVGGRRQEVYDDHLSFMQADIPSVDLIDLDYGKNNRYWHSPDDTLDKCSEESLDAIGRIVLLGLAEIETSFVRR